jgi:homoserine O-acetyltransferase
MLALVGSNPVLRQRESPTLADADRWFTGYVDNYIRTADANDVLYALEASWDYDPGPGLGRITAPLLAVNFADDLVNPPELGILEREIARVPKGRAVVMPFSEETRGHGSHTIAGLWKHLLAELLAASDKRSG